MPGAARDRAVSPHDQELQRATLGGRHPSRRLRHRRCRRERQRGNAGRDPAPINTSYIERLNATFRAALAPLTQRGRRLAHGVVLLTSGLWLVGTAYNFCWPHASLCRRASGEHTGQERTPAMAAGLTNHPWTRDDLLRYHVLPEVAA